MIILPVYKVYRGYIVFVFSVTMFVCVGLCVDCFCSSKISSYLSFCLFVHFSFSPIKNSVTDFWASMRARVFKFCIHLESGQLYGGKENQDAEINFCLLFPFLLFPSLTPM